MSDGAANYRYVRPSDVDSPARGNLNQARQLKQQAWARMKTLRARIKSEPLVGNRHSLQYDLFMAQQDHHEALLMEQTALQTIEKRANELGQTIRKSQEQTP